MPDLHSEYANLSEEQLPSVLNSDLPVFVDFFAEWCGPCKAMAPALDLVASEMKGKVKVVKVDVDKNPIITQKYSIQAMPTLILFHKGLIGKG